MPGLPLVIVPDDRPGAFRSFPHSETQPETGCGTGGGAVGGHGRDRLAERRTRAEPTGDVVAPRGDRPGRWRTSALPPSRHGLDGATETWWHCHVGIAPSAVSGSQPCRRGDEGERGEDQRVHGVGPVGDPVDGQLTGAPGSVRPRPRDRRRRRDGRAAGAELLPPGRSWPGSCRPRRSR